MLMLAGLFKKVCIADVLGVTLVDPVFAAPSAHNSWTLLIALYGYAFQIYYDFGLSAKLADSCGQPTAGLRNTNFNASSGRRLTPLQPLSQYWQGLWATNSNDRLLQALVVGQHPSAEMAESPILPGTAMCRSARRGCSGFRYRSTSIGLTSRRRVALFHPGRLGHAVYLFSVLVATEGRVADPRAKAMRGFCA